MSMHSRIPTAQELWWFWHDVFMYISVNPLHTIWYHLHKRLHVFDMLCDACACVLTHCTMSLLMGCQVLICYEATSSHSGQFRQTRIKHLTVSIMKEIFLFVSSFFQCKMKNILQPFNWTNVRLPVVDTTVKFLQSYKMWLIVVIYAWLFLLSIIFFYSREIGFPLSFIICKPTLKMIW